METEWTEPYGRGMCWVVRSPALRGDLQACTAAGGRVSYQTCARGARGARGDRGRADRGV